MALTAHQRTDLQTRIDRAVSRAYEQARAGVLPTLLRWDSGPFSTVQVWSVPSRTSAGQTHIVDLTADCDGIRTMCSCEAGKTGAPCWHRALSRLAANGEVCYFEPSDSEPAAGAASDDVAAWAAVA